MLPGNTLGALIEVVLVAGALGGSGTFCQGRGESVSQVAIELDGSVER